MSWLQKLLPPRIKREEGAARKSVPEGLWTKCPGCEAVLYSAELEKTRFESLTRILVELADTGTEIFRVERGDPIDVAPVTVAFPPSYRSETSPAHADPARALRSTKPPCRSSSP